MPSASSTPTVSAPVTRAPVPAFPLPVGAPETGG
jgi:hypothetical protein